MGQPQQQGATVYDFVEEHARRQAREAKAAADRRRVHEAVKKVRRTMRIRRYVKRAAMFLGGVAIVAGIAFVLWVWI